MSNSSVNLPTVNDDPSALGLTAAIASIMVVFSSAVYLCARRCPKLHDAVYSPAKQAAISGAAGYPGLLGVFHEVRHSCTAVAANEVGLEAAMILRFIALNLQLLAFAVVLAVPLLFIYSIEPPDPVDFCSGKNCTTLQELTILHVPSDSGRLIVAGLASLAYAIFYAHALGKEYRGYAVALQQWLMVDKIEHATVLLSVGSAHPVTPEEAASIIEGLTEDANEAVEAEEAAAAPPPLRGGRDRRSVRTVLERKQVLSVLELKQVGVRRRLSDLLPSSPRPAAYEGASPSVAEGANVNLLSRVANYAEEGASAVIGGATAAASTVLGAADNVMDTALGAVDRLGDVADEPDGCFGKNGPIRSWFFSILSDELSYENRFLVLLRYRRTASFLRGGAEEVVNGSAGGGEWLHASEKDRDEPPMLLRVTPAPPPSDVLWANLQRSRCSRRVRNFLGVSTTLALYLLWTFPVAAIQVLASLRTLSTFENSPFEFLNKAAEALKNSAFFTDPKYSFASSFIQKNMSSFVLIAMRYCTLHVGIFEMLVRLQGAMSHTKLASLVTSRMMLFQLLLVLLLSVFASSLLTGIVEIVQKPLEGFDLLARTLPKQATFFLNYVSYEVLFLGLFDTLQVGGLIYYLIKSCCRGIRGVVVGGGGGGVVRRSTQPTNGSRQPSGAGEDAIEADGTQPIPQSNSGLSLPQVDVNIHGGGNGRRAASPQTMAPHPDDDGAAGLSGYYTAYTRMVLISSIYHVFLIVAPLVAFFGGVFFVLAYPIYGMKLTNVLHKPSVDSAGKLWQEAVAYQTTGLIVSQVLLLGFAGLTSITIQTQPSISVSASPTALFTVVLVAIALVLTLTRAAQMPLHAKRSRGMPLQRCAQLDRQDGGVAAFDSLQPYEEAAEMPRKKFGCCCF